MPLPVSIAGIISRRTVENSRVEYCQNWDPESVLHTICAFANDTGNEGGGYIVIGMGKGAEDENKMSRLVPAGLGKSTIGRISKELEHYCSLIEPHYAPAAEHALFEGSDILVLWIPGGQARPYKCPITLADTSAEKACYIRKGAGTVMAEKHEEQELILVANSIPFDDRINKNANVEDMRPALIAEYLYNAGSSMHTDVYKRPLAETTLDMRLVSCPGEHGAPSKPLNAGLMFFNERPDNFFRYARIEVVDKPEPTGRGMTEKIFYGPLDYQLRYALRYIQSYIITERVTKVPDRAEAERAYNYPYEAVREALTNAVMHKSYEIAEPVTVMVTPDKMEITSLPGPDKSISPEDIANRKMVSERCRNRRIGDFLKTLRLAGERNTGIPIMLHAMKHNGSDPPVFETDDERSYLTVILPVHRSFLPQQEKAETGAAKARPRRKLPDIKKLVLKALKRRKEASVAEIARELGYAKATSTLRRAVLELAESGKIAYTEPGRLTSRNQKLRLK